MSQKKGQNPIPKILPKVFNLIFLALLAWAGYYGFTLYQAYDAGYKEGMKAGKVFYQRAVENHWRALSLQKEKGNFIEANAPKRRVTWKDSLYRQGWESAIDASTENLPH